MRHRPHDPRRSLRLAPLLFLAVFVASCAGTPPSVKLQRMFDDLEHEVHDRKLGSSGDRDFMQNQKQRMKDVHEIMEADQIKSAADYLHASVILVESDQDPELLIAHGLALKSAELGEPKGFRVAAEATDKLCVKHNVVQKYGTQYVYEPVIKAWRLYPYDPNTTDTERQAMGVEPLDKLREREAMLNKMTGGKPN